MLNGVYRFRPKVVAFRNDYCLTCNEPRRSVQVRTFNVLHFHGIPILPVGFWKRWQCTACTRSPGYNPRSRRKFAITLALLAAVFIGVFWMIRDEPGLAATWLLVQRIAPIVMIGAIVWAIVADGTPSTATRLANVQAAQDTTCPFCETPLSSHNWQCPTCGVRRK